MLGAGETAMHLRALAILPEDPNLVLSTHTEGLTTACKSSSRDPAPIVAYVGSCMLVRLDAGQTLRNL